VSPVNRNGTRRVRTSGGGSSTTGKPAVSAASDWYIITGHSQELLENEVKPLVTHFLRTRGLELSEEKTRITHIEDGFDFLGQTIRKYGSTLLITPSKKNVLAFLDKVRSIIKANKQTPVERLIRQLNPVIRGWAQYHQHIASKATFRSIDHAIFQAMWRWAQRRHPTKSKGWTKRKYVRTVSGRDWVFYGEENGRVVYLYRAYRTPIKRHTAIKAEANPFDPQWERYFEQRLGVKMEANLQGRRQLLGLWKEQEGLCPVCKQTITEITGWHTHHSIWRSLGGPDTLENRVLLHPNCHMQVHTQKVHVEKPRPTRGEGEA
jgi:RNA-directed DNA polymerase